MGSTVQPVGTGSAQQTSSLGQTLGKDDFLKLLAIQRSSRMSPERFFPTWALLIAVGSLSGAAIMQLTWRIRLRR